MDHRRFTLWVVAAQAAYAVLVLGFLVESVAGERGLWRALLGGLYVAASATSISRWRFRDLPGLVANALVVLFGAAQFVHQVASRMTEGSVAANGDGIPLTDFVKVVAFEQLVLVVTPLCFLMWFFAGWKQAVAKGGDDRLSTSGSVEP